MDRKIGGQPDRWMDRMINRYKQTDGPINRQLYSRADGWKNRQIGGQPDRLLDKQVDRQNELQTDR